MNIKYVALAGDLPIDRYSGDVLSSERYERKRLPGQLVLAHDYISDAAMVKWSISFE